MSQLQKKVSQNKKGVHLQKRKLRKAMLRRKNILFAVAAISLGIFVALFAMTLLKSAPSGAKPGQEANKGTESSTNSGPDTTAPVLTLIGETRYIASYGVDYVDPGYTAIDDRDGNITASVIVESTIDTHVFGEYTVTYTATDSSGNTATAQRIVVIRTQSDAQAANPPGKIIYLSFDDGPGPYTQQLLDILDEYNVKATFFVTRQSQSYTHMIGEAHRRGHTIAMHSYSHRFQDIYANETAYFNDLNKLQSLCEEQTGETPKIIRFPGGTCNVVSKKYCTGIMSALVKSVTSKGYVYCDWNVDSDDAGNARTPEEVFQNVIGGVSKRTNSYVLQHDLFQYSVEAVDEIIRWGLENGYTFLPLTEDTTMIHQTPVN